MAGINMKSSKKKKKQKDGEKMCNDNEDDTVSSTIHDTEERGESVYRHSEDLTLSKSHKKKKKKRKRHSDEDDLPNTNGLERHNNNGIDSVNQHQKKHKKSKKRKRHSDSENDLAGMDTVDQDQKKLSKRKKHSDGDNDIAGVDSVDQHKKKHKKSKKQKRHSDELPVDDDVPDKGSRETHQKKGIFHSFCSALDYPMEKPSCENPHLMDDPAECFSDHSMDSDETMDSNENEQSSVTMDSNENEQSSVDPDSATRKSSSESSKKKKRPSTSLALPLTLTDEEAAIVHNGKISSLQSELKSYKKMGINIRVGKWTQQEDSILVKNYEAFKSEHAMEMDNDFLLQLLFEQFVSSTKADRAKARKFRKHSNFCVELAGNLRRLPESVLDRARKILPAWNTGPFTPEEEETLLSLHKKFGNQWTIIGYHMNRSRNSVLDHYQVIKDGKRRKGTWTKEESDDLIAAMSEVMETDDLFSLPHYNIPWTKICKKIKHRSGKQCRTHWLYNLLPKLVQGGEHVKQVDATKLITEVYNLEVETECEIDWEDMLEKMPEAGTPQNLIHQWQRLKAICGVDSMNFDQIREKLAEFYKTHV